MKKIITHYSLFIVVIAIVLLAVTGNLFSTNPIIIVVQILAVSLSVWARRSFPAGAFRIDAIPIGDTIIRRGPYHLIRHPMYSAVLVFIWVAVLSHLSVWTVVLGGGVTAVVGLRIMYEERFLRERYPDYPAYVQNTKMVVPYLI